MKTADTLPVRHFINSESGGLARFVEHLLNAQVQLNHRNFELYGPSTLKAPTPVLRDDYRPYTRRWGLNQWKFAVQSPLRPHQSNVILHYHNLGLGPVDVFTVHGLYSRHWLANRAQPVSWISKGQFSALSALEKHMLHRAKTLVFNSTEMKDYVENTLKIKRSGSSTVITPGVEPSLPDFSERSEVINNRMKHFPHLDSKSRWLLFVGNDFSGKGLLRLLTGLQSTLGNRAATANFLIFGSDQKNRASARQLADSLSIHAEFFENDADLLKAYQLSDVFLMDSLCEGFGLVVLEAMSAGCVPFVTNFGGVGDVISHTINGWVGNDAQDVVAQALSTPAVQLESMSRKATETARRYTWERTAEQYEAVYRSL